MKDIRKPEFMAQVSSKGHSPILEILIALVVFFVGSMLGSFVQMPALMIYLLGNREYLDMIFSGRINMVKMMEIIADVPQWITIVLLVGELGIILAVFFYCRLLEKRKLTTLGFQKKGFVLNYVKGIVLGLLLFCAAYLICYVMGSLSISEIGCSNETILYVAGFLGGYLIQGMAEEVLCRGYLLVSLSRRCSVILSVVVSSLFFSMLHGMNQGITLLAYVNLFLFGVFMALLFIRYENIWIVGAVHSIWNFAQGNLFGVQVSGMKEQPSLISSNMTEGWEIVNGGAFGLEGGLAVTLVLGVAVSILLYSMKRRGYFVEIMKQNIFSGNDSISDKSTLRDNINMPDQDIFVGNSNLSNGDVSGENSNISDQRHILGENNNVSNQDISDENKTKATWNGHGENGEVSKKYENMGLKPEEAPWYPKDKEQKELESNTGFDQSYFKD